ncbi:MAG: ribosomal protein S18-alanine N-acetyltransferase [Acidobacteria bacterium]|nr:ribosomal protein S18-alanine N-acetyltransferase [Acidobacteriota bacterium]
MEVWRAQDYVNMLMNDTTFHGLVSVLEDSPGAPSAATGIGWEPETGMTRVLGFIAGRIVPPDAEVYKLAVGRAYRRQGIGSRLMEEFLDMARARRAFHCYLEVRRSNLTAIRFYRSHGFSGCRIRPLYYANPPEDAFVMSRREERK